MADTISEESDPVDEATLERLYSCRQPLLIGVRHHSAAMARAVPLLLTAAKPRLLLIELPDDFQSWIPFLGHPDTEAPIALAGMTGHGDDLCFYPFADFSPELAAIRWAHQNQVPVVACDLGLGLTPEDGPRQHDTSQPDELLRLVFERTQTRDVGVLWERMVETPGVTADPESIRRAGLLFGWALRCNDSQPREHDLRRETRMRAAIAEAKGPCAAVVGAYHAAALLPEPMLFSPLETDRADKADVETALIPYAFEQLDERSGYPAGIRDPVWHQAVFDAQSPEQVDLLLVDLAVKICRQLRAEGHPANAAHAKEVVRFATDLARLRGFPHAGRGELMEAMQSCLTQGELMGMGRAVAKAMEHVLVGTRRGDLPSDVPRSGLAPHVEQLIEQLQLPGPGTIGQEKRMRLDPLRSKLDRARHVFFERLQVVGIPYAKRFQADPNSTRESLTEVWDVSWQHGTTAMLQLASSRGVTLAQAAGGVLRYKVREQQEHSETQATLRQLHSAASCGLGQLVNEAILSLQQDFTQSASLAELGIALQLIGRIRAGHFPGVPENETECWEGIVDVYRFPDSFRDAPLLQAAISRLEGVSGSEQLSDVMGLLELLLWFQQQSDEQTRLDDGKLLWSLRRITESGSAVMQGAAWGGLLLLQAITTADIDRTLSGWIDGALQRTSRTDLMHRLQGLLIIALPRITTDMHLLSHLETRLAVLPDDEFLQRLPALRGGFGVLSPADRNQLLQDLLSKWPDDPSHFNDTIADDPELAAARYRADQQARQTLLRVLPDYRFADQDLKDFAPSAEAPAGKDSLAAAPSERDPSAEPLPTVGTEPTSGVGLPLAHRWRLILGSRQEELPDSGWRIACALDELYGGGPSGRNRLAPGPGAGRQQSYPTVREWAGELEALFGNDVCEEVLGRAAESGRTAALSALDPEEVQPSVELLEQVLSLKGAMGDDQMAHLRRICRRIVDELARELSTRIRPALVGLATRRPTSRPTRRLDIPRTIRANLHTARVSAGKTTLVPERLIFQQFARRSMDWHVVFVVDVSGSMESSVIYSAMMSAILTALPALSVTFLAFSTKVIDLSAHVEDPLALLLEVQVGGGTHIAKGLRAARQKVTNPRRTLLVLVTDFDEGWPVGELLAEVRAIVDSGITGLGLAALNDQGTPRYHQGVAQQVAAAGMPVAALSPMQLARWVGDRIR